MTKKDLISKIQSLRQIKPNDNWAILAKNRILNSEIYADEKVGFLQILRFAFSHKYAFASLAAIMVFIGTVGISFSSTPGDALFSIKKAVEDSQGMFATGTDKVKFDLDKASKRLDDLTKIAQENNNRKLNPAISEYKASVSQMAQSLAGETSKDKIKELVAEVKKLENREIEIKSLGIEIGDNYEKDLALVKLITDQVKELGLKDLTPESQTLLEEVKKDCVDGKFVDALEKILVINNFDNKPEETVVPSFSPSQVASPEQGI